MEKNHVVTLFKKVDWENLDILKLIKEAVQEARSDKPEVSSLKIGDIGMKRFDNHVQLNLYFVDPPTIEEVEEVTEEGKELEEVSL